MVSQGVKPRVQAAQSRWQVQAVQAVNPGPSPEPIIGTSRFCRQRSQAGRCYPGRKVVPAEVRQVACRPRYSQAGRWQVCSRYRW